MKNLFTLEEFVNTIGDRSLITAIYLDDENNTLTNELSELENPVDAVHEHENLLQSDDYLKFIDGEYKFDIDGIYEKYAKYFVSFNIPKFKNKYAQYANRITTLPPKEYIESMSKYCDLCEIVIKPSTNEQIPGNYKPEVSSGIDCWMMLDYRMLDVEATDGTDYTLVPLGAITGDDTAVQKYVAQRTDMYTAAFQIINGNVCMPNSLLYYTDDEHNIVYLGTFETANTDNLDTECDFLDEE